MLTTGRLRAVVLNSGGANACTGPLGFQDTHATAEAVATALSDWGTETGAIEVAVCSTGLIGDRLPMDKVLAGVTEIVHEIARRTDRRRRRRAGHHDHRHRAETGCAAPFGGVGENWTLGGMAKGAGHAGAVAGHHAGGVDHRRRRGRRGAGHRAQAGRGADLRPARRRRQLLDQRHRAAAGIGRQRDRPEPGRPQRGRAAGVRRPVRPAAGRRRRCHQARSSSPSTGADTEDDALVAARVIARDSLVKTALFGSDPNWGRVLAAVGIAPVKLDPERISVSFNGSPVCIDGAGAPGAREVDLSGEDIDRRRGPGRGGNSASIRTTDLSHAYVEENSAYSS